MFHFLFLGRNKIRKVYNNKGYCLFANLFINFSKTAKFGKEKFSAESGGL
jgi:hypothetical protein